MAQQHLDLGIEATKLIGRPLGQGIVDSRINPKKYLLAVTHGSRVERRDFDDWQSRMATTEHDQEVAHHRCLALLRTADLEPLERQELRFDHADSTLDVCGSEPNGLGHGAPLENALLK
jgi:hypothetical protein